MKKLTNKLRVSHFAQVPCKPFIIEVTNEIEAKRIMDALTLQHLFLFKNKIIGDYSNIAVVEMFEEDSDGDGNSGWSDYFNEEEGMVWNEFEDEYLEEYSLKTNLKD